FRSQVVGQWGLCGELVEGGVGHHHQPFGQVRQVLQKVAPDRELDHADVASVVGGGGEHGPARIDQANSHPGAGVGGEEVAWTGGKLHHRGDVVQGSGVQGGRGGSSEERRVG